MLEEIKRILDSFGVGIDRAANDEIVTTGIPWDKACDLVSLLENNGINQEKMRMYYPVSGYISGPKSRYKIGICIGGE